MPETVWHACEPAMTILPNFRMTGIVAFILGVVTIFYSLTVVRKGSGGVVLILLSLALLLMCGGIVPPVIGVMGGVFAIFGRSGLR